MSPTNQPPRTRVLAGLVGGGSARRAFIDAVGEPVELPPATIGRLVATDDAVGALLLDLGAPLVGCAGTCDGVAALRPDLIVTGAVDGRHDLAEAGLVEALRRVAPVVAVDLGRPVAAAADLRALLGPLVGGGRAASRPVSDRRVGAP